MDARCAAVLALPAAALLGACSDGDNVCTYITTDLSVRNAAGVETTTFGADDAVTLRADVTNIGRSRVTLGLRESCGAVYLAARDATDTLVWAGACPHFFFCVCASDRVTLEPGETRTITGEWNQVLQSGELAPGGSYTGQAVDGSECVPLLDDERSFTLVR